MRTHKMGNFQRRNSLCDCFAIGTILGVLGIMTSIVCALCSFMFVFILSYAGAGEIAVGLIVISVLNLVSNIIWLLGLKKKKVALLVASLAFWVIPLFVCLLFFAVWVHVELVRPYDALHRKDESYEFFNNLFKLIALGGAAYWFCFYSVAVWCFIEFKIVKRKSKWKNQRLSTSHAVKPAKNAPFKIDA